MELRAVVVARDRVERRDGGEGGFRLERAVVAAVQDRGGRLGSESSDEDREASAEARQVRVADDGELPHAVGKSAAASRVPLGEPRPVHASQPGPATYAPLVPDVTSCNAAGVA